LQRPRARPEPLPAGAQSLAGAGGAAVAGGAGAGAAGAGFTGLTFLGFGGLTPPRGAGGLPCPPPRPGARGLAACSTGPRLTGVSGLPPSPSW